MDWHKFITDIFAVVPEQPGIAKRPKFYSGVSAREIADAEVSLNTKFPVSLRSLLLESNGIMDMMAIDGGEWFDEHWLVWTLERVVEQNLWFRSKVGKECYPRDFHKVVFFADAGSDGILFGFSRNRRPTLCIDRCRLAPHRRRVSEHRLIP